MSDAARAKAEALQLEDRGPECLERALDAFAAEQASALQDAVYEQARTIAEQTARAEQAEALVARLRAFVVKVQAFDISPMFDSRGSYSERKSKELHALQAEIPALLAEAEP